MKKRVLAVPILAVAVAMVTAIHVDVVWGYTLEELLKLTRQIQNEQPGIELKIRTDKDAYNLGEDVVIEFMADKDCYVALIDIGTSGRTIILFPNKWHPDNKVQKNKIYSIPASGSNFSFRVMGPPGEEHIKALASVDPVLSKVASLQEELRQPIENKPEKGQVFLSMKDPGVVLKDIGIVFQKLDPSKWATVDYSFKINDSVVTTRPSPGEKPNVVSVTKPPEATEVYKGKTGIYQINYDPKKWKVGTSSNPASETAFYHNFGDMVFNVIAERLQGIPIQTLKKAFMGNLQKVATDETIKEEKELIVNGAPMMSIAVDCKIDGISYTIQAYLWTGDSEVIQFIGGTSQDRFPEFKDDIEKLLNGLVIVKP